MFVIATTKLDRQTELVNTAAIKCVYVNRDADPETIVEFTDGSKRAYLEPPEFFDTGRMLRRARSWGEMHSDP